MRDTETTAESNARSDVGVVAYHAYAVVGADAKLRLSTCLFRGYKGFKGDLWIKDKFRMYFKTFAAVPR